MSIATGSFTAVMGPSGSGKSSLLQCAAGLDRPSSGSVRLGDVELSRLSERRLTTIRRDRIGFVFQAYNLLPALTVEQNILMPLRLAGARPDEARSREVLALVGMERFITARAGRLSGGEQQRVAIARALINNPQVVFADEPTAALDPAAEADVLGLLRHLVAERSVAVVMVTHEPTAAAWADRVVMLANGEIVHDSTDTDLQRIRERMFAANGRTGGRIGGRGVEGQGAPVHVPIASAMATATPAAVPAPMARRGGRG